MPVFAYQARDSSGAVQTGDLAARDRDEALDLLYNRGLHVSSLDEVTPGPAGGQAPVPGWRSIFQRVPIAKRCAFWRQAAQQQQAGFTLNQTLTNLGATGLGRLSTFSAANANHAAQGTPLSDLMEQKPELFGPLEVGLIKAGEVSGRLDSHMERLAIIFEKEMEIRNMLRWRLAYLGCIAATFLLTAFVLAVVAPVIQAFRRGEEANILVRLWAFALPWLILAGVLFGVRAFYAQSGRSRVVLDRLKLSVPVIGGLFRKMAIARFSRSLGYLVGAGVPIGESLEIASATTGNLAMQQDLADLPLRVRQGAQLSDLMQESGQFPLTVVQMVRTGEQTGATDAMLERVAGYYEGEAAAATMTLATVGFAAMILIAGVGVLFFVINFYVGYANDLINAEF